MTLSIGSLFSGIGGLELGLDWGLGGAETRWQVEYEEHARLILAQHWPETARHKDVRHVGATSLEPVDLICGGFPCQPHSVAGKRGSSNDERDLWPDFARIIGELRPRWVVAENVPGLLSNNDPAFSRDHPGGFFGRVLRDLAALGFDAEWHSFPAAAVGAHHRRERVFIVAHAAQLLGHVGGHHTRGDSEGTRPFPESGNGRSTAHVADPDRQRRNGGGPWAEQDGGRESKNGCADVADPDRQGLAVGESIGRHARQKLPAAERDGGALGDIPDWSGEHPNPLTDGDVERDVRGVAHGISARVDRLKRLGNAVVPQQAAVIGRAIKEAEAHLSEFGVMPGQIVQRRHLVPA